MHRKTTENAVFTRNFEFIDPLRSFDRNMVFNYTNLTIRKGLMKYPDFLIVLWTGFLIRRHVFWGRWTLIMNSLSGRGFL